MADDDELVVQKKATVKDILDAHIQGMGGYEIAEKFGIDTEKVKDIIRVADEEGKFIPDGAAAPVDKVSDNPEPLNEGVNPTPDVETTNTKKSK